MSLTRLSFSLGCAAVLCGCVAEVDTSTKDEPVGESLGALITDNALSVNALNLNALNLNALNLNALNAEALSPQSLAAIQDPGPSGDLARELVQYATSCALTSAQTFKLSWTDETGKSQKTHYRGLLGLAPTWATKPLDEYGQRIVSACLAARVNYYQVPVTISARSHQSPLKKLCSTEELIDYPDVEGAFWGNLFGAEPYLHACYNSATVDNSRAHLRDCAAGHLGPGDEVVECGMIHIVGPCSEVCQPLSDSGQYYQSCVDRPGEGTSTTKDVITTALP